jgi:hypothetical protein
MTPDHVVSVPAVVGGSNRTFGMQLDHVTFGYAIVGPSPTDGLRFTITGLSLTHSGSPAVPTVVLFHTRQSPSQNQDFGWSDEFAVEVITTAETQITGRVLRVDDHPGVNGWGQTLRLDFLIIEA